ncbi:hypothetical protein HYY75_02915 [bacterium]|nr:hypothetical protein [bacterium]
MTVCSFSPDGTLVLSGSEDGTVKLWNLKKFEEYCTFSCESSPISSAKFSADGEKIFASSFDGILRMWDIKTKNLDACWVASGALRGLGVAIDGKTLAVGEESGSVYILKPLGYEPNPPIVTPLRTRSSWWKQWNKKSAILCPFCGEQNEISNLSPRNEMPCPSCQTLIHLN